MGRKLAALAAATAIVLASAGATSATDALTGGAALPFPGFTDMAVDPGTGRIFMTGGPTERKPDFVSTVYVVSARGKLVKRIDGLWGAGMMSLRPATHSVYVALDSVGGPAASIVEIDTRTLRVRHRFRLPATAGCPTSPEWARGRIWFTYSCSPDQGTGGLGAIDPAGGRVQLYSGAAYPRGGSALAVSPGGTLLAAQGGDGVALFSLGNGRPHLLRSAVGPTGQFAFTPDGRQLIALAGSPYKLCVYRVRDLKLVGSHDTRIYPRAVAISKDGLTIAGGANASGEEADVLLFRRGHQDPYWTGDFGGNTVLSERGLAWAGRTLYAVAEAYDVDHRALYALRPPRYVPGMPEPHVSAGNAWGGVNVAPPEYLDGAPANEHWIAQIAVTNQRFDAIPGRLTVRYYLPEQAFRSLTLVPTAKATLKATPDGALLTIDDMQPNTTVNANFDIVSKARKGDRICNRAVVTLPSGAQHTYNGPCETAG